MHLKALRLRGFKSFAHGVELRFESGIAVIIGPNGSGKSNIADGLQWAMAAQTPAQLRAPTAQDVLFGGSDSRPPAGVCEVELVLDNRCGTLPIEFAEVSVMRRLHRDSEGEYFINRSRVRRLDVLELLADTGLGREMHSVIGQGKVEEVLVAKPHERRRFVEEAAGLGKYQRRRSRAEAKLARVSAELERARDLEREVRARLRPLAMQATAAERAAKLGQEIAAGRLLLLSSELALERAGAGDLQQKLDAARLALGVVERRAEEIASRRATAESELAGLAAAQERAARAFYAFQSARDRLSTTAGRAEQVAAALDRAGRRRVEDASRLREDAARLLRDAQAAETEAGGHAAEVAELEMRDVGAADEALAAAEAALGAALDARRALANAQGQADTAVRELEGAAARVRELRQRVEQLEQTAATSASQLAEADVRAGEAATVLEQHRGTLKQAEAAAERAHQQAETVAERERAARAAAEELAHRLQIDRSRLDALDGMLQRGEGLPPAVRELQRAGARLVIHGVEAQPGFERAVAAALGWRTGAVVAEHVDEGLDLLHQGQGEMGVVLVSGGGGTGDMPPAPGARQLVEVVTLTDPALAWLLEGIWLVEDLARVTHGVAVTVAGTGIDADRGELWRTADAGEAAWMAARAERDQLRHSVAELEQRWTEAGAVAERLGEELTAASAAETAAAEALRQARLLESELAAGEREAAAKRDQLADQLARGDAARDLAAHDLEHETSRLRELEAAAEGQAAVLEERRAAAAAADERHAALDLTRQRLAEEAGKIAGRLAALRERAERFGAEAQRLREAVAAAEAAAERADVERAEAERLVPQAAALVAAMRSADEAAGRLVQPARSGVEAIEQRASVLSAELQDCAAAEASAQAEGRTMAGGVTELEVSLARSRDRAAEIDRRQREIATQHGLEPEQRDGPLEIDEAAALSARIERLERRRETLGAVNPLAQTEYEQETQRADDLTAQCDDLERSLRELRGLIRDVTRTIDDRFASTFQAVARNFAEVVETLFPGGRGRLRLTDDVVAAPRTPAATGEENDELQPEDVATGPGVELEVRPAGKRIESLTLLSGGEKSLTAIAFLFALMLAKPSPFYVLDEVEAALDDANIDRFLSLLRTYQDRAQFIVITHQRRTMEVADVLYGVTMAGDGESKVLSRRMPSEPVLHEAALESA